MKEQRMYTLLQHLSTEAYVSSQALANILDVSSRTIRNDIKELQMIISHHGADIIAKPQKGFLLRIEDREAFMRFCQVLYKEEPHHLPVTSKERVQYLLEYLLAADDYIKTDDLCDILYISKSSLSQDLKEVRHLLREYHLELVQRPNYGIKVEGKEFDLRLCIANTTINRIQNNDDRQQKDQQTDLRTIGTMLTSVFDIYGFHMSNVAFQNLIVHIYIAIERIRSNRYVPLEQGQLESMRKEHEFLMAEEIVRKLELLFHIDVPEAETGYIAIHLAGKRIVTAGWGDQGNIVIDETINDLVSQMLDEVEHAFHIDFRNDLELRMNLALHLIPMQVRMKYDMILHNPLLKEIKLRFTFAYTIAVAACDILRKQSHRIIDEDEIGYFALHFNLALERRKHRIEKNNILIVCATGRGSAELLVYKFRSTFGKYLQRIDTCDVLGLASYDFHGIDYIITTVPIQRRVPVPILEVSNFLEAEDVTAIRQLLHREKSLVMAQYFDARLFLIDVQAETKEEVLQFMCTRIHAYRDVPDDFYAAVMKREAQARTEFGNLVAIPHPNRAMSKETFVCVAILEKPIRWDKRKVQFVFMLSIENTPTKNLQTFYQITSKFLLHKEWVKEIIRKKDFQTMLEIFHDIELQLEE